MKDWKQRLYDNYISTGQAGTGINRQTGLNIGDYPYFSRLIRKHLPDRKDIAILDLACGHGALIYCLKKLGYCNLEGVDISPQQVALAHESGLREIRCQDMMDFLKDKVNAFDVIFLMDILEHLSKVELCDCLDQVSKSLTANGMVVIHVPNAEGIFGMRIRYGDVTHENCFTPQSIRQALRVCGIHSVECFEDKPLIHGLKSLFRYILWVLLTAPFRLLLAAETGTTGQVLSQNMLVVARKFA
ncbi:MAG: class I SAM-dependent methyltransferase [Planctomycetes bacterium]|nr:class I SAM-dependent methyltransferase [Planctomycetota bacterium]